MRDTSSVDLFKCENCASWNILKEDTERLTYGTTVKSSRRGFERFRDNKLISDIPLPSKYHYHYIYFNGDEAFSSVKNISGIISFLSFTVFLFHFTQIYYCLVQTKSIKVGCDF